MSRMTMSRTGFWTRTAGLFAILLIATAALVGCDNDKEYEDETPPVTGELEVEPDESELEAERELAEGELPPVPEGDYELEGAQGEVEVEDDEIEVEAEQEFAEGANPAFDPNAADEQQVDFEGTGQPGALPEPQPDEAVELTTVTVKPADFVGATVAGTVSVEEVISDRGFWVNADGNRIFAVVREAEPPREKIDIDAGQTLELTGLLVDGDDYEKLTGSFEKDTLQALKEQPYVLAVYWKDVQFEQGGSGS